MYPLPDFITFILFVVKEIIKNVLSHLRTSKGVLNFTQPVKPRAKLEGENPTSISTHPQQIPSKQIKELRNFFLSHKYAV